MMVPACTAAGRDAAAAVQQVPALNIIVYMYMTSVHVRRGTRKNMVQVYRYVIVCCSMSLTIYNHRLVNVSVVTSSPHGGAPVLHACAYYYTCRCRISNKSSHNVINTARSRRFKCKPHNRLRHDDERASSKQLLTSQKRRDEAAALGKH